MYSVNNAKTNADIGSKDATNATNNAQNPLTRRCNLSELVELLVFITEILDSTWSSLMESRERPFRPAVY